VKNGQNLRDLQQQRKEMEGWVASKPCVVCSKTLAAPYGRHTRAIDAYKEKEVWTCSLSHEREYRASLPRQSDGLIRSDRV
jgi:hypothetical protein